VELLEDGNYFFEEAIWHSPKAGTYAADTSNTLTSFYINPGSTISVPLNYSYSPEIKRFFVKAGPLKDQFNNTVADGTQVTFIYQDDSRTWIRNAHLKEGMASITVPEGPGGELTLFARVNETVSSSIKLVRP
jgi:hypothetical protein